MFISHFVGQTIAIGRQTDGKIWLVDLHSNSAAGQSSCLEPCLTRPLTLKNTTTKTLTLNVGNSKLNFFIYFVCLHFNCDLVGPFLYEYIFFIIISLFILHFWSFQTSKPRRFFFFPSWTWPAGVAAVTFLCSLLFTEVLVTCHCPPKHCGKESRAGTAVDGRQIHLVNIFRLACASEEKS